MSYKWTNLSVNRFAKNKDPIHAIIKKARSVVLEAMGQGWTGPPFDPFSLADILKVYLRPRDDLLDGRTVAGTDGNPVIEFNPNRTPGRVRFSIAHELAHTFFPDWREKIRDRYAHDNLAHNDWQLEMLCNVGAAEILMPIGSFSASGDRLLDLDELTRLRDEFQVSTEAMLLRYVQLTPHKCFIFAASQARRKQKPYYQIDYAIPSYTWRLPISKGTTLPPSSAVYECTAIGYTEKKLETWGPSLKKIFVESIGVPPYPDQIQPRVVGIGRHAFTGKIGRVEIKDIQGDATKPRGKGKKIVAHIVNDRTPNWGGGFGLALRRRWPEVQAAFRRWAHDDPSSLKLGNLRLTQQDEVLSFCHMICQHGYGESKRPRIRYGHLVNCLERLSQIALENGAEVHMPRLGSGEAGGSWRIVRGLVEEILCGKGIPVTVYTLPSQQRTPEQVGLPFQNAL